MQRPSYNKRLALCGTADRKLLTLWCAAHRQSLNRYAQCTKTRAFFHKFANDNMKHITQDKKVIFIIILLTMTLHTFSQSKNEFFIQGGYSQASQSVNAFNLFQTSFWVQNIHNGYFSTEYYRNINEQSSIGTGIQLVEKGFKNSYDISFPQYTLHQRYFFKLDYLEMPIIYRHKLKYFLFTTGILNSYLIKSAQGSAFIRDYANGKIQDSRGTSYNPNVFKKFDSGLIIRVAWEVRQNIFLNFSFTRGFIRPYIYNSGELNYNEVFLVGLSFKIN